MKQNIQKGASLRIVVIVLVLVGVAAAGFYLHDRSKAPKTASASAATTDTAVAVSFYDCWDAVSEISDSPPTVCSDGGKTYPAPTAFHQEIIAYLSKVPAAARPLVVADAKKTFDGCVQGGSPAFRPLVDVAQANFVMVTLECDGIAGYSYSLDGGVWNALGSGQNGLDCATVDKYGIKKASVVRTDGTFDGCQLPDGSTRPLS